MTKWSQHSRAFAIGWQNSQEEEYVIDFHRNWIVKLSVFWFGLDFEIVGLDLDFKNKYLL